MTTSFLSDNEGHKSSIRLIWCIVVLIIIVTWSYICISTNQFISFSSADVGLIGVLFAGKVGQKYVEENKNGK